MAPKKEITSGGTGTNYGAAGGLSAPAQNIMSQIGDEIMMEKKLALIELMGLEGKNQYEWRIDANGVRGKGQVIGFTEEESNCFPRVVCGPGREATFKTHVGDKSGKTAMIIKKAQYIICFYCCSRPESKVIDGQNGTVLGEIKDPFHLCSIENQVMDANTGKQVYNVNSSCLTLGYCCPCLADHDMDIVNSQGKTVGHMRRVQLTMKECICPAMNTWTIKFPSGISDSDKLLLCATQHQIDVNYMDPPRGGGD